MSSVKHWAIVGGDMRVVQRVLQAVGVDAVVDGVCRPSWQMNIFIMYPRNLLRAMQNSDHLCAVALLAR